MEKEKDVILMNKMCTGSYNVNNIGHEIINYFKADNSDNVYIYISPYGTISSKYDDKVKTILLTSSLANNRVEILAKIDNPEQKIYYDKEKPLKEIHNNQVKDYKDISYGGKTLDQIFKNNYKNEEAIYITFCANVSNMKKPKKRIFITKNKEDKDFQDGIYIHINRNIASSSLKQYFQKEKSVKKDNNGEDYDIINRYIENKDIWEAFEPEEIKTEDNDKINFLQLIEKEDEEQIYTNLLAYWFSIKNVFNLFLKYLGYENKIDNYDLKKEKVIPGGRIDILALGENNIIVIENKILSGVNGKEKDSLEAITQEEKEIKGRTQFSKYLIGIDKKEKVKISFMKIIKKMKEKSLVSF